MRRKARHAKNVAQRIAKRKAPKKEAHEPIVRKFRSVEEWMNWRLGAATGSRLGDMITHRGDGIKREIYRAVAESMIGTAALAEEEMNSTQVLDRGHVLEEVAVRRFVKETGKKVDDSLTGWEHPEDSRMKISPDASIGKFEAVEAKCFLSPGHVEVLYTKKIPHEYRYQMLQYFIVNGKLRTLYFVFFHPDFPTGLDYFCIPVHRKDIKDEIKRVEELERGAVATIRKIVNDLTLWSPADIKKMQEAQLELIVE